MYTKTRLGQDYAYNSLEKNKIVNRKVVALFLYTKTRLVQEYAYVSLQKNKIVIWKVGALF